jgi:hypothetical protein
MVIGVKKILVHFKKSASSLIYIQNGV